MQFKNIIGKIFAGIAILFFCFITVNAQEFIPTDQNSSVEFKVNNHMIGSSTVTGRFQGLKGKIVFNPSALGSASFDVSVNVGTIHTGISMRDNDLKKEKFFDEKKYPVLIFKSTSVTKGNGNSYLLHGNLTIKGTTKPVTIPFTATKTGNGYTFSGNFQLNRNDYKVGVGENKIDNKISVMLKVSAKKK